MLEQLPRRTEQSRLSRPIEVQATGVVAAVDAERNDLALGQQSLVVAREPEFAASLGRVEVLIDWLIALGDQGEAAAGAVQTKPLLGWIEPKRADRNDEEGG